VSAITTHLLDISRGQPASGVAVRLELETADGSWKQIGAGSTDADGRAKDDLVRSVWRRTSDMPEDSYYQVPRNAQSQNDQRTDYQEQSLTIPFHLQQ